MTWSFALLIEPVSADAASTDHAATITRVSAADASLPLQDRAIQHGDGIFETILVVGQRARDVDAHVERLVRSARLLDLPEPHLGQWRQAIALAEGECTDTVAIMKLHLSRGTEAGPSAWLTVAPAPDHTAVRERGVRVVTLDRGYDSGAAERAPWLLLGAKTLSYAVNTAALREAHRRGVDDAVLVTSDGRVLEGPTSSVIIRRRGRFYTPEPQAGALHGTTQLSVFAFLRERGLEASYAHIPASDLLTADAAWLVSSVRLAVPITEVDGQEIPVDAAFTAQINAHLLAPRD